MVQPPPTNPQLPHSCVTPGLFSSAPGICHSCQSDKANSVSQRHVTPTRPDSGSSPCPPPVSSILVDSITLHPGTEAGVSLPFPTPFIWSSPVHPAFLNIPSLHFCLHEWSWQVLGSRPQSSICHLSPGLLEKSFHVQPFLLYCCIEMELRLCHPSSFRDFSSPTRFLSNEPRTIKDLAPSYFSKTIYWRSRKFSFPSGHGASIMRSRLPVFGPAVPSAWNAVLSLPNLTNL